MPKSKPPKKNKTIRTTTPKPPVVTIMGHVDHGKTTLLDHIRNSNITKGEAGGITQHIGAYQITHSGKKITFIDTPGHAAFSKMRARGAAVTDIIILVVAADDGVMPQTKESIRHIKESHVPVIVAINKIDLKNAVPEMAKAQLVQEGIQVDGYGGNVPVIEISAAKGTNIDKLLDTILVLSEVEEITASPNHSLQAVVIEASRQKNQGPIATLLVQDGTLHRGQDLTSVLLQPPIIGKAKRLTSDIGAILTSAGPSTPVILLGLKSVPPAGTIFTHPDSATELTVKLAPKTEPTASLEPTTEESPPPESSPEKSSSPPTPPSDSLDSPTPEPAATPEETEEPISIKIILKADTHGSLEAVRQNLADEVDIISNSTGEVTESDVLMAKDTGAVIIAFHTPLSSSARKLAKVEKVPIKHYQIIYKLLEDFESQVLKLLEPTIDEEELGRAKVQTIFTIREATIAGCKVKSGKLTSGDTIHLKRGEKIIADSKISSLKQGKIDAKSIDAPEECGIILKPSLKIQEGDILIAFKALEE